MRRRVPGFAVVGVLLVSLAGSGTVPLVQAGAQAGPPIRNVRGGSPQSQAWTLSLPAPEPPSRFPIIPGDFRAASAVLMDGSTGEVLFARNPDEPRPPASITKILTALVILERGRLNAMVTVSQEAARVGGYRLGLRPGQQVSLEDLLAATLIRSANDAAAAAAEHVGGTLLGFVTLMNAKAEQLGMNQSRFANPHGLDELDHFTTARDMAILTQVALRHPVFARLVRTRETAVTIWKPSRRGWVPQTRTIQSHNKLLGRLEGADGVKTGYTSEAGQCLVASATRGGHRMIAVLLNDPQRWSSAAWLLTMGFEIGANGAATPDRPWGAVWPTGAPGRLVGTLAKEAL